MICLLASVVAVTFCCSLVFRLPASCAFLRRNCTRSITRAGSARKASPRRCTCAGLAPIMASTCGNAVSDLTEGSQGWLSTLAMAASPFSSGCALDQVTASWKSAG